MYPPPPREIIEALKGQIVNSIRFLRYVIHLSFESGDMISITCPFRFGGEKSIAKSPALEAPLDNSSLPRLIGLSVTHIESDPDDGSLFLKFENGDALDLYANNPQYEAYNLLINDKRYIV